MEQRASAAIYLEKRNPKQDGTYPVKIKVSYMRERRYYGTGISLTQGDFAAVMGMNPKKQLLEHRIELDKLKLKAGDIIRDLEEFGFGDFERRFLKQNYTKHCAFILFEEYAAQLRSEGRYKTALSYDTAAISIRKYVGDGKNLPFSKIDTKFLRGYEQWMVGQNGNSATTVGIYLRSLRAIYNLALSKGMADRDKYPFGNKSYKIPASMNIKKALNKEDIKRIKEFEVKPEHGINPMYKDFWMFSYYCNGINIKDMAKLRYKDISGDTIAIIRSKTENTTKHRLKPILIMLLPEAKRIIEKWGNKVAPDSYVFPILEKSMSLEHEVKVVAQMVQNINKAMRKVAKVLDITVPVTTYVARHSFATIMKRGGAPIEYISESLGHTNVMTTESYLGSFGNEDRDKFSRILLDL